MRRSALHSALAAALVVPAALGLTGAETAAADSPGQDDSTPNVSARVFYGHELVQAGGTDTMTIDLVNNGPRDLDDTTRLGLEVSLPDDTTTDGTVVEDITGNAPSGRNAVPAQRTRSAASVFTVASNGSLYSSFEAGSYGNGKTFRSYTLTVHIDPNVTSGSQLDGGGVTVTVQNYVDLTVAPKPPTVVSGKPPTSSPKPTPKPTKPHASSWPSCPTGSGSGSGNGGGGNGGGGGGNHGNGGGGGGGSMEHGCRPHGLANTGSAAGPATTAGLAVLLLGGGLIGLAAIAGRRRTSGGAGHGRGRRA